MSDRIDSSRGKRLAADAVDPLLVVAILPALLRFALPNMGATVAAILAAVAETTFVGKLGTGALAGMALVFPMVMLQQMLSNGAMGSGISSALSRALGASNAARADAVAVHGMWIGLSIGLLYMLLMLTLGPTIYALLGGGREAIEQAVAYSNVAFSGAVGVWLMNTFTSVIRGTGNMALPSTTVVAVALAQIFIGGALGLGWGPLPRLGMAGIAAGQVIAYACGAAFLYAYLRAGRARVSLVTGKTPLSKRLFIDIVKVGALACVSPVQTVATLLILTWVVAQLGSTALAGYGIATRLEFLSVPVIAALGMASLPLVGMAIGAGKVARARRAAWTAAALSGTLIGSFGLLLALAPQLWGRQFSDDDAILAAAAVYFHWVGPCYALYGMGLCLFFSALGAGKVGGPVFAGTLRFLLIAIGGGLLVAAQAPPWTVFALVALAMVVYGLTSAASVHYADWGEER